MAIAIILCMLALLFSVCAIIVYEKSENKQSYAVILMITGIICMFSGLWVNTNDTIDSMKDAYKRMGITTEVSTDIYYAEAEIISGTINENNNVDILFSIHGVGEFVYETEYAYSMMSPYLITMDGNGTEDVTDDKILVVWKCMN